MAPMPEEGVKLVVVVVVFLALCFLMVGLRVWSRVLKRQSLVINDYACFVALVRHAQKGKQAVKINPCGRY